MPTLRSKVKSIYFYKTTKIRSIVYLDNYEACKTNIARTTELLQSLDFLINERKSNIISNDRCKFLDLITSIELPGGK